MKKSMYGKRRRGVIFVTVLIFISVSNLMACSQIKADSFIEIENEEEQYKEMEQELKDLKLIRVRCLAPKRFKEMQEKIYENYFRNKDDVEHQQEKTYDSKHVITYETGDIYQLMEWGKYNIYYNGELFGRDCVYETTEEQIIQEETAKLFELLGLTYNNMDNGYAIDRMVVQEDNSVVVYVKKYIDGKELSLSGAMSPELLEVDSIQITFGNNQIIGIDLVRLSETIELKDYEEDVLVDTPPKAYKLLVNFYSTALGIEKWIADTAQIAYVTGQVEDDVYVLRPMAEFYRAGTEKVYQVDLTTKEVMDSIY